MVKMILKLQAVVRTDGFINVALGNDLLHGFLEPTSVHELIRLVIFTRKQQTRMTVRAPIMPQR
ncbi:hypothetical protein [Shewanella sp. SM23]|uniref:hypothetical protein n=1 Tax=Shewanella sp. SM23 TaxID=2912794 RepID=UPI0021D96629|nr:hypothetical protein [Shewanella sp. SM23]MCU8084259.1 hypothetical protein [Shewanella sp. SM23]